MINHAALKGGSTTAPIVLLNSIIEDARSHDNKELWIVCQDMTKAFDSVGLTPIEIRFGMLTLSASRSRFHNQHVQG